MLVSKRGCSSMISYKALLGSNMTYSTANIFFFISLLLLKLRMKCISNFLISRCWLFFIGFWSNLLIIMIISLLPWWYALMMLMILMFFHSLLYCLSKLFYQIRFLGFLLLISYLIVNRSWSRRFTKIVLLLGDLWLLCVKLEKMLGFSFCW